MFVRMTEMGWLVSTSINFEFQLCDLDTGLLLRLCLLKNELLQENCQLRSLCV